MQEIVIEERFRGPSKSANGGYITGLLSELIDGPAEITLKAPPPLETPLALVPADTGYEVRHGERPVAIVRPGAYELEVPAAPPPDAVDAATARYNGRTGSPVPHCFVCGVERAEGDALRIFTGPVEDRDLVAAPWVPAESLAGADGHVMDRYVFAALDCPGAWAWYGQTAGSMLLGRMVGQVTGKVRPGERCTVMAWPIRMEGRKAYAGSAVLDSGGAVVASGLATWIAVDNVS